jgi:hypothetical protein
LLRAIKCPEGFQHGIGGIKEMGILSEIPSSRVPSIFYNSGTFWAANEIKVSRTVTHFNRFYLIK